MIVKKISYGESIKKPTQVKYESKSYLFSAEAEINEGESVEETAKKLKELVREQLKDKL